MTDFNKKLEEAIARRDKFLEENPDLQNFQDEINRVLDKCLSPAERMDAISIMIGNKLNEFTHTLTDLQEVVIRFLPDDEQEKYRECINDAEQIKALKVSWDQMSKH